LKSMFGGGEWGLQFANAERRGVGCGMAEMKRIGTRSEHRRLRDVPRPLARMFPRPRD